MLRREKLNFSSVDKSLELQARKGSVDRIHQPGKSLAAAVHSTHKNPNLLDLSGIRDRSANITRLSNRRPSMAKEPIRITSRSQSPRSQSSNDDASKSN